MFGPFARPWSLWVRLTVLVVGLAAPLLLVVVLSYADAFRDRRALEVDSAGRSARNGASIVEGFLRDLESTTFAMAGLLAASDQPYDQKTYGPFLAAVEAQYTELRAFFITDPAGHVVASASGEGIGIDLSSRPYMVALRAGADRVWSGGIAGLQSGDITVAFGRPIRRAGGTPSGYLVTAFYPERLLQTLKLDFPADAQLALIDERGRLLYASDRTEPARTEIDLSDAPGMSDALKGLPLAVDGLATPFAGEPRYGALVPIARTGWVLSVTRPLSELDRVVIARVAVDAAAVVGSLLLATLVVVYFANRLARPLRDLSRFAAAIARGERPAIPEFTEDAEVARLSHAMRAMQSGVAQREDELRLLASASEALSGSLDYAEILAQSVHVAVPDFADWCVVDVLEHGRIARSAVGHADQRKEDVARLLRESYPTDPAALRGPLGAVLRTGRPVLEESITEEYVARLAEAEQAFYRALAPRSVMCVPLVHGGVLQGAITFATSESGRRFSPGDLPFASQLARRIALGIENARLYYEVQQSVRTRDDFLSAVAHELKTPLTVISGAAQIGRRRLKGAGFAEVETGLERIVSAAARMAGSIEELLELVRRRADPTLELQAEPTDLGELARRVVADVGQLAPDQRIDVDVRATAVGEWDRVRIERALGNLLSNAIKYSPDGGRIVVRIDVEESGDGTVAVCSISDEGIGVPDADRTRIFERFTRGSNVAGRISGSGVGLAIVRQIVQQHGGSIELRSRENGGSVFTVRLPLAGAVAAAGASVR